MRNLYGILGISEQASVTDIKAAFRKQARDKHPDANQGAVKAKNAYKELNRAHAILSDPNQRALYDRGEIDESGTIVRAANRKQGSPFEGVIKRRRHEKQSTNRTIQDQGADVSCILKISFMEAMHGATKHVSMTNGKRLRVTIPPGIRHEQTLRLKDQGMGGIGGAKDGDALVEILVDNHNQFFLMAIISC